MELLEERTKQQSVDADQPELLVPNLTIYPASRYQETENQNSMELLHILTEDNGFELTIASQPACGINKKESTVKADNQTSKININMHFETSAKASKSPNFVDDQDQLFLNSLLPDLKNLDSDQKLEFRKQILVLLERIRRGIPKYAVESHPFYSSKSSLCSHTRNYLSTPAISLEFRNSQLSRFQKKQLKLIELHHQNENLREHYSESSFISTTSSTSLSDSSSDYLSDSSSSTSSSSITLF